ncbi:MAG: DUF302 domain-containing protein [Saprospiraceae bacterium]|nr:DUF302 domain-containing protein [Saprospiraceae bacterium]
MQYFFNKTISEKNFEQAVEQVTARLKDQGFGVLTEIDISATLKKKIDVDFKPYTILGACHPHYAHQALLKEDKIGVFLPCNVIVEQHKNGEIEVSAVDPIASMMSVENEALGEVANEIQGKLKAAISQLQ